MMSKVAKPDLAAARRTTDVIGIARNRLSTLGSKLKNTPVSVSRKSVKLLRQTSVNVPCDTRPTSLVLPQRQFSASDVELAASDLSLSLSLGLHLSDSLDRPRKKLSFKEPEVVAFSARKKAEMLTAISDGSEDKSESSAQQDQDTDLEVQMFFVCCADVSI